MRQSNANDHFKWFECFYSVVEIYLFASVVRFIIEIKTKKEEEEEL